MTEFSENDEPHMVREPRDPHSTFVAHMARCSPATWVTKDGQAIQVRRMGTGHLVNTIRLLRRWARFAQRWEAINELLSLPRGAPEDVTSECVAEGQALSRIPLDQYIRERCPVWERLLSELAFRVPNAIEPASEPLDEEIRF